jgi:F-type H+-transporting ATPase subunit b
MNINVTLFGQMLSFAVFVWFTMKFVWPPIVKAMEERKAKIAEGLAAAERGQHEQELAEKRAKEALHEAKRQAAEIKHNAEKQAALIVEEARDKAKEEGHRQMLAAQAEIEQETNKAREVLRARVAELAVLGAEKILRKEIDANVHRDIVESVARQI